MTQEPELGFRELDQIIKSEPSLCYRLLRYLNSPVFDFRSRITSVRHALSLVAEQEIGKWISVAALVGVGVQKPPDLVMGRWCVRASANCWNTNSQSRVRDVLPWTVSALPVLLDLPVEFIVTRLPILPEIQTALLGGWNHYRQAHDLVLVYEAGQWDTCVTLAKSMAMSEEQSLPVTFRRWSGR